MTARQNGQIHGRVYNVRGPNHLWHIGSMASIGIEDRFSRLPISVLTCFSKGFQASSLSSRVRSDRGRKNVLVAVYMLDKRGTNRRSMIAGTSAHNQHIKHLWRDVYSVVLSIFTSSFISWKMREC